MTIPKEKAVFRLDKNGAWHVDDEKFTNQKIINHFHSLIKKDEDGYFLEQEHSNFIEKVYFSYEDTPLIVFRVIKSDDGLILHLNTGERIKLDPEKLLMKNNNLYNYSTYALRNESQRDIDARNNWWGSAATTDMGTNGNPKNIANIWDQFDEPSLGQVNYSGWLDMELNHVL